MLYRYCDKTLSYKRVRYVEPIFKSVILIAIMFLFYGLTSGDEVDNGEELPVIILNEWVDFSEDKLIEKIKILDFRFPHIVLAQAKLESGHFTSTLFLEANNIFGMKKARARANTALRSEMGYAYYDSWVESLYDYALFYNAYLNKIRDESQYYEYLVQNYAEDPRYVNKLKQIIEKENLKSHFEN
jgi:uncharacterized FlgJ-related protein